MRKLKIAFCACCRFLPAMLFILSCILVQLCGCQRFYEQQKNMYMEKGRELFNQGDYIAAAKKYENVLVYDKRCADAMCMLGQCSFNLGNYQEALEWFEKAGGEQPLNMELKVKIAEILMDLNRPKRFKLKMDAILRADPNNTGARVLKLDFLVQKYNFAEAEKLINDLLKEGKQSTRFYKVLTEYYIKKAQYPEAVKTVLEHFTFNLPWMKTITILIKKLEENGRTEDLIKINSLIIEQAPNKVPYQEALSALYRKTNDKEMEDQLFHQLLKSNPGELQLKVNYMGFLVYYKQQSKAKAYLDLQLKNNPEEIALTKSLIIYYVQTQQIDTAVQLIQESLTKIPSKTNSFIELQNMLAAICFDDGNLDAAATIANEIIRTSKSNRDARFLLCKINLIQGDIVQVIGDLRLLIRENQNIAEFHYYLGLAHEMKDEPVLAEKEYREALNINPNYKDALKKWLAIYPMQGALTEVEQRIDKYLRSNPKDQDIIALRDAFLKKKDDNNTSPDKARQERTVALPGLL